MSDGVHVAIDVILPPADKSAPFPTVLMATRYWRSFAMRTPDRPRGAPRWTRRGRGYPAGESHSFTARYVRGKGVTMYSSCRHCSRIERSPGDAGRATR